MVRAENSPSFSPPRTPDCEVPAAETPAAMIGEGCVAHVGQVLFFVLCTTDYRALLLCFPLRLASAPTDLNPLLLPAFIRPAPDPVLSVSGPLLFEFRLATDGVFVDVPWGSLFRPLLAGRCVREGVEADLVCACLCLLGALLPSERLLSLVEKSCVYISPEVCCLWDFSRVCFLLAFYLKSAISFPLNLHLTPHFLESSLFGLLVKRED